MRTARNRNQCQDFRWRGANPSNFDPSLHYWRLCAQSHFTPFHKATVCCSNRKEKGALLLPQSLALTPPHTPPDNHRKSIPAKEKIRRLNSSELVYLLSFRPSSPNPKLHHAPQIPPHSNVDHSARYDKHFPLPPTEAKRSPANCLPIRPLSEPYITTTMDNPKLAKMQASVRIGTC